MKRDNLKVKIDCMIFILLVICIGQVFSAECGDVNSSGAVDIIDALLIAQDYVGLNPSNFDSSVADVNADGNINIVDSLLIAQFYVGLIDALPGCSQKTAEPTNPPVNADCSNVPVWSADEIYDTAGTRVQHNGNLYENNWYSQNQNPETNSGENAVWTLIGSCDPNSTPSFGTATPTPGITPTPTGPSPTQEWQGTAGYATRFWDCCKPHCGWTQNVPSGMSPLKTCQQDGVTMHSNYDVQSSCNGGSGYMCYNYIPWAVNGSLSYGFSATSSGDVCGRCYELQFTGEGHHGSNPGAEALGGKRMIVQIINIGGDVGGGQFDLLIPGGGLGAFNGCTNQWGIPSSELGVQYGGLLTACQKEFGSQDHEALKSCVRDKADELFSSRGLNQMADGIDWFVDWFEVADNPNLVYREISCPQELINISGMQRP